MRWISRPSRLGGKSCDETAELTGIRTGSLNDQNGPTYIFPNVKLLSGLLAGLSIHDCPPPIGALVGICI